MSFQLLVVLSAIFAVSYATVSGDGYSGVGVQTDQTVRGALNTLSSYSKAVNTAHSQSFVSRTDYTNNPGVIAHAPIAAAYPAAYHAPIAAAYPAAYHAPIAAAYPAAYHAPIAAAYPGAYHAPIAAAYHAPIAASPYAYGK